MSAAELERRIPQLETSRRSRNSRPATACTLITRTRPATCPPKTRGLGVGQVRALRGARGYFRSLPETLHFAIHYILNPIIEVNGERATGVQFGYGFY